MIQASINTAFKIEINTEANRINRTVPSSQIRHLMKFTNDLSGSVFYAYGNPETITARYTQLAFTWGVANVYTGVLDLAPAGYYKYEAYEISWEGPPVVVGIGTAPVTETDTLTPSQGRVEGLVAIGKLYLSETRLSEEVQYVQNAKSVQTLTIQNGGTGFGSTPTLTFSGGGSPITTATATCTIALGVVNTVTITNAGSGYTSNPTVTVTGGAPTNNAQITATIEQENYIYYQ